MLRVGEFIAHWPIKFPEFADTTPWRVADFLPPWLANAVGEDGVWVDPTARIEAGAVIKGPCWIGPGCFGAATAYLRGGVWLERDCIVGPGSELKSSMMFAQSKLAHLNFIGDSLIGTDVNIEAGAIIANYRNEMQDKQIRIRYGKQVLECNVEKFGALVGDGARLGANAVIAPGALIKPGEQISRLSLVDQHPGKSDGRQEQK